MQKTRILIVEDELVVAEDIGESLTRLGYDAIGIVASGEAAIEQTKANHPNLILMDIALQGQLDGIETAKRIRSQWDIPIIYLTAHSDPLTLARAKRSEPFGYVTKPYEENDLHVTIEIALHKYYTESRLRRLNRMLRASQAINQFVSAEQEPSSLLQGVCDILSEYSSYPMWLMLLDRSVTHLADQPQLIASTAMSQDQIFQLMSDRLEADKPPQCICVLREQEKLQIELGPISMCGDCPLAVSHEGRQRLYIRLQHAEEFYGVLCTFPASEEVVSKEELSLLGEAMSAVALTLHSIGQQKQRKLAEEAQQVSEQRFRSLFSEMSEGVCLHEMLYDDSGNAVDYRIMDVNPAYESITQLTRQQVIGSLGTEIYDSGEAPYLDLYNQVVSSGNPSTFDTYFSPMEKHFRISVFSPGGGQFATIFTDITEQKQAAEALQESEERLRATLETTHAGYFFVDERGVYGKVNDAWLAMHGYDSEDEVIGQHFSSTQVEEDLPLAESIVHRLLNGQAIPTGESSRRCRDGSVGYHTFTINPVRKSGEVIGLEGFLIDVTEQRLTEEALLQSEKRYRELFNNANDIIYTHDLNGKFLALNQRVEETLGYTSEEALEMSLGDITTPSSLTLAREMTQRKLQDEEDATTYELEVVAKDGSTVVLEVSSRLIHKEGRPVAVEGIARDITVRKRAEEEKKQLEEQYRQSQKVEAIGRLAGGVAHDLNNMLTPILGYSDMLLDELGPNDTRRNTIDGVIQAGQRAKELVRQLLAFSRKQTLEYGPVNLNEVVTGFEMLLRRTIREDIVLESVLIPEMPTIMADIGQLEQVLMNLVVNAQDAMPEGGRLTIQTELVDLDENYAAQHQDVQPGPHAMLSVTDTGHGIDDETREHLFEPFYSTKGEQGTGLGLATVYGIVKQHGGSIWVYSEQDVGTTFKIYLPITGTAHATEDTRQEEPSPREGTETILLVEDDEHVRHLAHTMLQRQGYNVLAAEHGAAALRLLESYDGPVHLLLTDVVMPAMSGKELSVHVTEYQPDAKVLYMSGYTHNVIAHRGVLDEGIAFLQKPFTMLGLTTKIREVLEQN